MARWKLTESHYLKVPGTKWEYQEVDRITGRPKRTQYDVPLLINPLDLDDLRAYGQPFEGEIFIFVTDNPNPVGKDIYFTGDPTPGMVPVDDEARKITAKFNWSPTLGTDELSQRDSHSNMLLNGLIEQMAQAQVKAAEAPMAPGMAEFMKTMGDMMTKQTEILAMLAKSAEPKTGLRNVGR